MITRTDVEQAAARIAPYVRQTPVVETGPGAFGVETSLLLKLEQLQHTGVFKPRGAFNRLLATPIPAAGVIAASGGNHAVAVAYAAGQLGATAELFVPASSPRHKAERVTALGAEVTVVDGFYAEAHDACTARQRETGALMVHAYDMPDVVAGQGTVGLELLVQAPGLDTVLVAVGGGGLVGGVATALGDEVAVVGVETTGCPTWNSAREAGEPVDVEVDGVAADSLGARRMGSIGFAACTARDVGSVLVSDDDVVRARELLWRDACVVAEPGGATALAALTNGAYTPRPGERVAVLVCGANTDPASLRAGSSGIAS